MGGLPHEGAPNVGWADLGRMSSRTAGRLVLRNGRVADDCILAAADPGAGSVQQRSGWAGGSQLGGRQSAGSIPTPTPIGDLRYFFFISPKKHIKIGEKSSKNVFSPISRPKRGILWNLLRENRRTTIFFAVFTYPISRDRSWPPATQFNVDPRPRSGSAFYLQWPPVLQIPLRSAAISQLPPVNCQSPATGRPQSGQRRPYP